MASWSGLFDNIVPSGATAGYVPVHSQSLKVSGTSAVIDKNVAGMRAISRVLRGKALKEFKYYLQASIGDAAGSVNGGVAVTEARVGHPTTPVAVGDFGGARTIDSFTVVAGSTTVSNTDETNLKAAINKSFAIAPGSMPSDASGNGGGGRLTATYRVT